MISPLDPIEASHRRQRPETPVFWLIVLAGSLLIHLLLLVAMRSLFAQAVRVPIDPEPITVEFVEGPDQGYAPAPGSTIQASRPVTVAKPTTSSAPLTASSPPAPLEAPITNLQAASPASEPLAAPRPVQPVPQPSQSASDRPDSPAPQPSTLASSNPIANPALPPGSAAVPLKEQPPNSTNLGLIASGIRLPDVPDVPNPSANPGRANKLSNLPTTPLTIPETPTPAKFLAQVQLVPLAKEAIASPPASVSAAIQGESKKEFVSDASSCLLTPDALSAFGKPVVLNVPLDEKGQLKSDPTVIEQNSSGNSRYDELAICALKQWTFSPAYDQDNGTIRTAKPTTIQVQVKITK